MTESSSALKACVWVKCQNQGSVKKTGLYSQGKNNGASLEKLQLQGIVGQNELRLSDDDDDGVCMFFRGDEGGAGV